MVLTGGNLLSGGLKAYEAFFTDTFAAANGVQNNASLGRSFQKCCTFVN